MSGKELRAARNEMIINRVKAANDADKPDVVRDLASHLGLTETRVKHICIKAGVMTIRKHDQAKSNWSDIIAAVKDTAPSERNQRINELAEKYGYSAVTIRQKCSTLGIQLRGVRKESIDRWLRIIGEYRRCRSMKKIAEMHGMTIARVSSMIRRAELYGIIEPMTSAIRSVPEVSRLLKVIQNADDAIQKILAQNMAKSTKKTEK